MISQICKVRKRLRAAVALNNPNQPFRWLKLKELKGLEDAASYFVRELRWSYTGAELKYIGLPVPNFKEDFQAESYHLAQCTK